MKRSIILPVLAALAVASCGSRGGNQQPAGPGFPGAPGANVTPSVEVVTATSRDVAQEGIRLPAYTDTRDKAGRLARPPARKERIP